MAIAAGNGRPRKVVGNCRFKSFHNQPKSRSHLLLGRSGHPRSNCMKTRAKLPALRCLWRTYNNGEFTSHITVALDNDRANFIFQAVIMSSTQTTLPQFSNKRRCEDSRWKGTMDRINGHFRQGWEMFSAHAHAPAGHWVTGTNIVHDKQIFAPFSAST